MNHEILFEVAEVELEGTEVCNGDEGQLSVEWSALGDELNEVRASFFNGCEGPLSESDAALAEECARVDLENEIWRRQLRVAVRGGA